MSDRPLGQDAKDEGDESPPVRVFVQPPVPVPSDGFLASLERPRFVYGERRWRSHKGKRIYTWDSLHGEVEVFNSRGRHLGAMDDATGEMIKDANPERSIDV